MTETNKYEVIFISRDWKYNSIFSFTSGITKLNVCNI